MMRLFGMECKKIAGSILYWVLVLALMAVSIFQYEPSVESELRRVNDPSSVFYTADSYAPERGAPDEAMEQNMMTEATKLLMYNYRDNSYLYYPFGYVKEKTMSTEEQAAILQYLMELTGLSEQAINGTADETADETDSTSDTGDIPISGGGAFVFKPGEGSMNENGQFVIGADEGQYVPGDEAVPTQSGNGFEIQVSFERFKEIMEKVNKMIGPGSYFSWPMLKLYYFGNDMEEAPISERQHKEFYEGDKVTGAFARYYCDSISISVLFLPAFVIVDLMLRDKRRNMRGLIYPRTISSAKLICTRYAAAVCITMLPILILPVKSLVVLMRYCGSIGVQGDVLAFVKYTLAWILPTVMLVMAVSLLVTVLLENYVGILVSGTIWLVGNPTIDKLEGGNYGLCDLIIRHNTLRGYGRVMENIQMLALNRITISVIALALVGLAVLVYSRKRKGGLTLGGKKSTHNHRFKFTAEH
ncbi:hypothetical protein [Acutalibacter caecimuris]|uniref:hypothetical protein n=1 Tax=Acutalibacter caecimuris TaxID=3093657 RepID=UPI002AC8ACC2|nr:hypothetical protein [Acutalibacter sp. M00118]